MGLHERTKKVVDALKKSKTDCANYVMVIMLRTHNPG